MAISGGYAGQLFGYLIGFGVSMLKTTLMKGPQTFDLFDFDHISENFLSLLVVTIVLIILASTFIYGILNNYRMSNAFAIYLFVIYGIFMIVAIAYAISKAYKHF